eukprot:Gregarina_sp_Poly_1__10206@NODE_706_length_6680_cov_40_845456_g533_i0_p1_GENE_NODE_706_length_6680_cov_40_845456_g533_i0NODE_706_length_6680_cov_40_845456_g533_i0_p1_ORF_typecomplete_len928_score161_63DUF658/PF04936_12/0_56_NODE_706_length_6680_cov_40_845456_g533_i026585441
MILNSQRVFSPTLSPIGRSSSSPVTQNVAAAAFLLLWSQLAGFVARLDQMAQPVTRDRKMSCEAAEDQFPHFEDLQAESIRMCPSAAPHQDVNSALLFVFNKLEAKTAARGMEISTKQIQRLTRHNCSDDSSSVREPADASMAGSFLHGTLVSLLCAFLDNLREGSGNLLRPEGRAKEPSKFPTAPGVASRKDVGSSEVSTLPGGEWGDSSQRSSGPSGQTMRPSQTVPGIPNISLSGVNAPPLARNFPQRSASTTDGDALPNDEAASEHSLASSIDAIDFLEAVFNSSLFNFCLDIFVEARNKFHAKAMLDECQKSASLTGTFKMDDEEPHEGPPTLGLQCEISSPAATLRQEVPSQAESSGAVDEMDLLRQRRQLTEISSVQQKADAKIRSLSKEKEARDNELREQARVRRNLRIQVSARNLLFEGIADLAGCSIDPVLIASPPLASDRTETTTETDARSQDECTNVSLARRRRLVIPTPKVPTVLVEVLTDQKLYGAPIKRAVEAVVTLKASERTLLVQNLKLQQYVKQAMARQQKRQRQCEWEYGDAYVPPQTPPPPHSFHNRWSSRDGLAPPCCGTHSTQRPLDPASLRPLQSCHLYPPPLWPNTVSNFQRASLSRFSPPSLRWDVSPRLPPPFGGCGSQFCSSRACGEPAPRLIGSRDPMSRVVGSGDPISRLIGSGDAPMTSFRGSEEAPPRALGWPSSALMSETPIASPRGHHSRHVSPAPSRLHSVPSLSQPRKSQSFMVSGSGHLPYSGELCPAMSAAIPEQDTTPTHTSEDRPSSHGNGFHNQEDGSIAPGSIPAKLTTKQNPGRKSAFGWQSFVKGWWLGGKNHRRKEETPSNRRPDGATLSDEEEADTHGGSLLHHHQRGSRQPSRRLVSLTPSSRQFTNQSALNNQRFPTIDDDEEFLTSTSTDRTHALYHTR